MNYYADLSKNIKYASSIKIDVVKNRYNKPKHIFCGCEEKSV